MTPEKLLGDAESLRQTIKALIPEFSSQVTKKPVVLKEINGIRSYGGEDMIQQVTLLSKSLSISTLQVCFLFLTGIGREID